MRSRSPIERARCRLRMLRFRGVLVRSNGATCIGEHISADRSALMCSYPNRSHYTHSQLPIIHSSGNEPKKQHFAMCVN